jgi:hypothetical protein
MSSTGPTETFVREIALHTPGQDGTSPADIRALLERAAGGALSSISLRTDATAAVSDESDFAAAAVLRCIRQPIQHANAHLTRDPLAREVVVRPVPPPDAHLILEEDPRFRPLLRGHHDLRSLVEDARPDDWYQIDDILMDVESVRKGLNGLTLEGEVISILAAALGSKRAHHAEALGRRFGTDGEALATLDEVGRAVGVTRERIRQIQGTISSSPVRLYAPAADTAVHLLDDMLPARPDEIGEVFAASGISHVARWRAKPLVGLLALTGRSITLDESEGLVAVASDVQATSRTLPMARAVSNLSGSGDVTDVMLRLADEGRTPGADLVTLILRNSSEVHWFTSRRFWVSHPEGRNRLVNTSLRILSVIQPQTMEDMLGGVERNFRWRASTGGDRFADIAVPNIDDLAAFYASHPAFEASPSGKVTARTPVDMEFLGEEKITMVSTLLTQRPG